MANRGWLAALYVVVTIFEPELYAGHSGERVDCRCQLFTTSTIAAIPKHGTSEVASRLCPRGALVGNKRWNELKWVL